MGIVEKNYKTFKGFPKVHIALFILTFFWPHYNYAQNELPTVAVLDFEGRGISEQEASSLTDRLATEQGNTDAVILVERKQLIGLFTRTPRVGLKSVMQVISTTHCGYQPLNVIIQVISGNAASYTIKRIFWTRS